MKILFLNSAIPNYVTDGLFHGLQSIPGIKVIDIPRIDTMYLDASAEDLLKTGSKGSTLYKLLPEAVEVKGKRTYWQEDMEGYDLIIFTEIYEQCDLFHFIYNKLSPEKRKSLCIVDGQDSTAMFPYMVKHFNLKVRPWAYLYQIHKVPYFKREYAGSAELYGLSYERFPLLSKLVSGFLKKPGKMFPISMSIPEEHIEYIPIKDKSQDFVNYNVDTELEDLFPKRPVAELGKWQPAFGGQEEYYQDIRHSRFGITARRAGWDCLRHYEYAAKGAVLCFRNLEGKSAACAPFGLNAGNCISYGGRQDLLEKIKKKSAWELEATQERQYRWIENYTTKKVAQRFLDCLNPATKISHPIQMDTIPTKSSPDTGAEKQLV